MIQVLYFARLREALGSAGDVVDAEGATDVAGLLARLRERGGVWAAALGEGQTFLVAVNQEIATPETTLRDGDEVAFFPPVTGG
jgi:molybdopterin synthase sulfur carrier subunit